MHRKCAQLNANYKGLVGSNVLLKMGLPRPLFRLFSVFSNKHYKFLQQIYVKKCPSSIWCWDSNPRPLERESPPITRACRLQYVAQDMLAVNNRSVGLPTLLDRKCFEIQALRLVHTTLQICCALQ